MVKREPRVMICVPMLSTVPAEFFESMMNLQKPKDTLVAWEVNSLVYTARASLAQSAFKSRADYILWLDSDMVFNHNILLKLLQDIQGKQFVCGLYFKRVLPVYPMIAKSVHWDLTDKGVEHKVEIYKDYPDKMFEIEACGFGCVLMQTKLIYDMAQHYGTNPFEPLPGLGEDYSFCWRLKNMGIKMYCDPTIKLGHIGTKIYGEDDYEKTSDSRF